MDALKKHFPFAKPGDEVWRRAAEGFERAELWLDAAESREQLGQMERAGELYRRGGDLMRAAEVLLDGGLYEAALELFQQREKETADPTDKFGALLGCAACHYRGCGSSSVGAGRAFYRRARALLEGMHERRMRFRCFLLLGRYGARLKRQDLLEEGYERALEAGENAGSERREALVQYLAAVRAIPDYTLIRDLEQRLAACPEPDEPQKPVWAEAAGQDEYGRYADFSFQGVRQRMRWIEKGRFMMGSPESEAERWDDEGPQHEVTLSRGFWLADTACTQALWQAVTEEDPSHFKGPERPVEQVSWEDVQGFLRQLNEKIPGLELRLPTEAEWEYACRAGTRTPFWFGGNITPEQVNYQGNRPYAGGEKGLRNETVEVKALPCNTWGLYQMHGNVREWCADWFGNYADGSVTDPMGPDSGASRACRGGSWDDFARLVRAAFRYEYDPGYRYVLLGFRCARVQ